MWNSDPITDHSILEENSWETCMKTCQITSSFNVHNHHLQKADVMVVEVDKIEFYPLEITFRVVGARKGGK